jgi:DNA-binding transcriptional LysR family regulator
MGLGVAILPRRLAATELARGELVAIRVPELKMRRQLRLVHRRTGPHSHATDAFIAVAHELKTENPEFRIQKEPAPRPMPHAPRPGNLEPTHVR